MHFIQGLLTLMALGASVVTAASLKERQATPPPPQVGAVVGGVSYKSVFTGDWEILSAHADIISIPDLQST